MSIEEIRKDVRWLLFEYGIPEHRIDDAMMELSKSGVAIKVDKELPERKWFNDWGGASGKKGYDTCYSDVMMAGYTPTAPLIEEAKSGS